MNVKKKWKKLSKNWMVERENINKVSDANREDNVEKQRGKNTGKKRKTKKDN